MSLSQSTDCSLFFFFFYPAASQSSNFIFLFSSASVQSPLTHLSIPLLPPLRVAFAKESEVLTGNLGDKLIPQNEILRDVSDLKALANLHESMEWLAARLKAFFSALPQAQGE